MGDIREGRGGAQLECCSEDVGKNRLEAAP